MSVYISHNGYLLILKLTSWSFMMQDRSEQDLTRDVGRHA